MPKNIELLRNIELFRGLPQQDLESLSEAVREKSYKKGSLIFYEGDPGESVFFIREGKVKIYKESEDGREHILHILGPGDIFAEVVLFNGGDYPAAALCLEDSSVGVLRDRDLERLLSLHPSVAIHIIQLMARRLRQAQEVVKDMALKNALSRTASTLLRLAEEYGQVSPEGDLVVVSLSNQELANLVGTTRETVNRVLNAFKKEESIDIDRRKVTILDRSKLESWI